MKVLTLNGLLAMPLINAFGYFRGLFIQIHEDWEVHYRDWTRPGFRALAVHRFGAMLKDRRSGGLWWILSMIYRCMFRYIRNHYGIELPDTTIVGRRFHIGHQHGIVIHYNSVFGDDCTVHQNVTIGEAGGRHGEAPKLGNRVVVGAGAAIIGKIIIGDDVRIAPNATVMTNVLAGTIVCAPPPRLINLRHRYAQAKPIPSGEEQVSLANKE